MINLENKKTVQEIVNICIDKEITVGIYPHVKLISVFNHEVTYEAYYCNMLYNNLDVTNETTFTLSGLLKKVKSM